MGETFKEFCRNIKIYFSNTVYIKDVNSNNPIDFSAREIKIDGDFLIIDNKRFSLSKLSENHIIIINGSVEKIENCKNVFVAEDVNLITNTENVICTNIEGNVFSEKIQASEIIGNVSCHTINCKNIDGDVKGSNMTVIGDINGNVICKGDLTQKGTIEGDFYESFAK